MKVILEEENTLRDNNLNRHVIHQCILDKDYKKMQVIFQYTPKYLDDDEKEKEWILDTIDKYTEGKQREEERDNWKRYKGIKNNITVSIDDNNGFRGMAHRRDQLQKHLLSLEKASPGFIAGIVPKGKFVVTVSVHALVTEECKYKVTVVDMEDEDV